MLFNKYSSERAESEMITLSFPGGEDHGEDTDRSDLDDEDFEDMAEDRNDIHEMELENDIFDPDDDDHLPDDDLQ